MTVANAAMTNRQNAVTHPNMQSQLALLPSIDSGAAT
jgi:hypothetical protein